MPGNGRLQSIDFLRGLAALAVVIEHCFHYSLLKSEHQPHWFQVTMAIASHGHLGVPLFFVISGFCIHLGWAKRFRSSGTTSMDFIGFWKRRLHRLYPPYFVALVVSMSLVLLAYALHKSVPLVNSYPDPKPRGMALDFLLHLLMLHGFAPLFDKLGGNPPFWTLAREEYLYALYFLLLWWRVRRGILSSVYFAYCAGGVFYLAMQMLVRPDSTWWPLIVSSALVLWIQWSLGMLSVEHYIQNVRLPRLFSFFPMAIVWGVAALWTEGAVTFLSPLLWGLTFFTIVNNLVQREQSGRLPFNPSGNKVCRLITWSGTFSYSTYLVHNPTRAVLTQLLGPFARTSNPFLFTAIALFLSAAGLFAGWIFYCLVERHFLNVKPQVATAIA